MRTFAPLAALLLALVPVSSASAQAAHFCLPGQSPQFVFGFAQLKAQLGPIMGEPVECEHPNSANGDTLQQTTTGLSFWRKATNTSTFTDGYRHWGLTPGGLAYWEGSAVDPPVGGTAASGQRQGWQTYENWRYGFSVSVPADWPIGQESTSGDGVQLYVGNPDVRISAYGSLRQPDDDPFKNEQTGFRRQYIRLDSGREAALIVGREEGKIVQDLVILTAAVEHHLYVKVTDQFFRQHEATLMSVMRGFRVLD